MFRVKQGYVSAICFLVAALAIGACGENDGSNNNELNYDGGGLQWVDPVGRQDAGTSLDAFAPPLDQDQGTTAGEADASRTDTSLRPSADSGDATADVNDPGPTYTRTLWFPHVPDPARSQQDTEFAIINTSSHQMPGELVAYDEDGGELTRLTVVLDKHARVERLISANTSPFITTSPVAYIRFNHDVPGAVGYTRYIKHENNTRAAVPAVSAVPTTNELYSPNVASNDSWRSGFSLLNTTNQAKTLTFEFVTKKADGSCGASTEKTVDLAAGQRKTVMIKDLFGSLQKDICAATIKNAAGVLSYQGYMGNTESEPENAKSRLYAMSRIDSQKRSTIYVPHAKLDSDWWGAISLFDPSLSSTNTLTITAYDGQGNKLSTKPGHPMTGRFLSTFSDLIADEVIPEGTASFVIRSSRALVSFQGYGGADATSLIMYNMTDNKKTFGVFGVLDDRRGGWLGYSLFNPNNAVATIRLELWKNAGGAPIETEILTIPAWGTVTEMAGDRFSSATDGTYMTFRASQAVVGLAVNAHDLDGQETKDGTPAL